MPTYQAPVRDIQFLLDDVLQIDRFSNLPGFSEAPKDLRDQILQEAARFCESELQPLNRVGDQHGCVRGDDGSVTTPPGFPAAYAKMVENGWVALAGAPEYGGQGLPDVLGMAFNEMASSANMAFAMYPGLTTGAARAIEAGGDDAQKQLYLPKMTSGEWSGTMNLTEPHAGTDLGLLRTKAVPQPDGTYKISGQKIWISGGEQDFTDNIIHLVLARIEGAPEGVKGISLFIVPKFLVNADGSLGARNALQCGGLEEKMGIHGNATCVMNYDGATGYLIGEAHKGLKIMFVMMNEARLGVAVQGLAQSEVAYQNAATFAKERLQMRSISGDKRPDLPADPIIVHPDVRRMLMEMKAFNEGARALMYWLAHFADLMTASPDEAIRDKADDYMALLTPVVKAYFTDKGFENCSKAMQIHGGSGFTEEWGISQLLRDSRIAMIYEGTNGVQALDLVGRKLAMRGMRPITTFFAEIDQFIADNEGDGELGPFIEGLRTSRQRLDTGTQWLVNNGLPNPDDAGAASMDYLYLFALTGMAYMWAMIVKTAQAKLADGGAGDPYLADKIITGRFFLERILPEGAAHLAKLETGSATMMAIEADRF